MAVQELTGCQHDLFDATSAMRGRQLMARGECTSRQQLTFDDRNQAASTSFEVHVRFWDA